MLFIIFYFGGIIIAAKAINAVSDYWPGEDGNWAIITHEAYFPGFSKEREAEKYAKEKGLVVLEVIKLSDA